MNTWTQQDAIALCVAIEQFAPNHGAHVALTGGCLYKTGIRRDCDIVLYRHDKSTPVNWDGILRDLATLGIKPDEKLPGYGYYHRTWQGERRIDFLCREEEGEYPVTCRQVDNFGFIGGLVEMNTSPFCFESLELLQERQRRVRQIKTTIILALANLALLPFGIPAMRAFWDAFRP